MNNESKRGIFFALCAAGLNGTIGVFSKLLIAVNLDPAWVAFIKTIVGFVMVSAVLLFFKVRDAGKERHHLIALAAFFGIFTLFYFETAAYKEMSAANVVIILMAVAAMTANFAGWLLLGDKPSRNQWCGFVLTVIGIAVVLGMNLRINLRGFSFSLCAGIGYGLFTVLLKKFQIQGGLALTRQLLFFGAIYLFLPAMRQPFDAAILAVPTTLVALLALAILPSILGFYCTTKAINYLPPAKVQLLELSEPLFSATIAFLVLGENVTSGTMIGAVFIITGIYMGAIKQTDHRALEINGVRLD